MIAIQYLKNGFVRAKVINLLHGIDVKVSHGHLQAYVISKITGFNMMKE